MSDDERPDPEKTAESVKWLRDHGVKVETPEDRKNAASAHIAMYKDTPGAREVTLVRIPADEHMPMAELCTWIPADGAGDLFPTLLKPFFTQGVIDGDVFQRTARQQHGMDATKVSAATMQKVTAQGSVETFRMVPPADTNDYTGVYVYLDEVGMLKSLPINPRAEKLGESCGFSPAPVFYGDVFIGRVKTKPSPMINVSFGVRDMDSSATWMQRATQENYEFHQAMGQVTDAYEQKETKGPQDGVEEGYTWTQNEDDIDISVSLPTGCTKKDVKVTMKAASVAVHSATHDFSFALDLYDKVLPAESTWSISDGMLNLTLEKKEPEQWRQAKKL